MIACLNLRLVFLVNIEQTQTSWFHCAIFFLSYVCLAHPNNTQGENKKHLFLNMLKAESQFPSTGKMLLAEGFLANGHWARNTGHIAFSRARQQSQGFL